MFKSYVTIALRNFWKYRSYTVINLIGLAIGFASVLMIIAYLRFELSYDTSYSNADRIYRCIQVYNANGTKKENVFVNASVSNTLALAFPEFASFTGFVSFESEIKNKDHSFSLQLINSDSNFFKLFNLPFLYGNATSASKTKGSIIITEATAKKLFNTSNPVGLTVNDAYSQTHIVSGVIKDLPQNIHFRADAIIANGITKDPFTWDSYSSIPQYILLRRGVTIKQLENKLNGFYKKYSFPKEVTLRFQPVQSIHLHSSFEDDQLVNSDIRYVYIFSAIALLILFIACINYVNLTTARCLQRTREVGVRKVMGAGHGQLVFQFLAESFLFFAITLPLAVVLAQLLWPFFAGLLHLQSLPVEIVTVQSLCILLLISVVAGILSGVYPALFLSSLQPAVVLKSWKSNLSLNLRKSLIVLQFVISMVLIIATIIIQMQLHFINKLNLGFNKEHLLILPRISLSASETAVFKQELTTYKNIGDVAVAGSLEIGKGYGGSSGMNSTSDSTKAWNFAFIDADFDFIKTMQIPVLEGRAFSTDYANDGMDTWKTMDSIQKIRKPSSDEWMNISSSQSIILTTKTAELIHLPKPYIGQTIKLGALQGTVIGITGDFNGLSLKQKNPAIVLQAAKGVGGNLLVRIRPDNVKQTLAYIEKIWKKYLPEKSFQFTFADDRIQSLYDSEQRLALFFGIFAGLGIAIACSGLFSLIALIVQQRTKEIGIRKILGAGINNIVRLLSADFMKLVLISIVIASPIAWWTMHKWLQDYDYESRITIQWWMFALAGGTAATIAFITVSVQAYKAAAANPVKSLRTE